MAEIGSAFISLMPSLKGFGASTERQLGPQMTTAGKKSGSRFGRVFASATAGPLRALGTAALGLFAAQKVTGFFKDSIAEAREAQVVTARTQSVIKSMGLTSVVSADQIGKLAMSISNKTAVDDEAIQSGQNLLLTFGNIAKSAGKSNGVFAQTSQLMVDMSAAMGTDVKSSAIQLGKALNDPVKGVSALTRVGVSFTQQQKDQIAALVESGNLAKAQGIVLREVGKQFGGAAASMATPAERAKVAWANFQEQIGTLLLPVIDRLLSALSSQVIPAISTFVTQIQTGTGAGGTFAFVMGTLAGALGTAFGFIASNKEAFAIFAGTIATVVAAVKVWTIVQAALNVVLVANPIGLVVVALGALAAGLVMAYQKSETFRAIVDGAFSAIRAVAEPVLKWLASAVGTTINLVRDHWRLIITILGGPLGLAVALVTKYWGQIKAATTAVWNAVKSVIATQVDAAKAAVNLAINAIRGYFNLIGAIVGKVREWFSEIVSAVKSKLGDAVDLVKSFPGKVTDALGNIGSALYEKGKDLIQGLINGIKSMAGAVGNAIKGVLPDIPGVDIPGLARGGPVAAGKTYLVGERGPELFTSSRSGYIVPNTHLSTLSGRSSADMGAKLDKLSRQLEVLTRVSAAQGQEFGRELNHAAAHGVRRAK